MFAIKMNEDKTLSQTIVSTNYENENKAEKIWFLLPKQYGDVNLSDCSIQLYVLNPNNLGKTYTLNLESELYKDTFLQSYFTITTDITSVTGNYEIWLNIVNVSTSMVIKTASTYLPVLNKKVISNYFSSSDLSTMDKIIVETTAIKDTAVTASEMATQKASAANVSATTASDCAIAAQQTQQAIETAEPARVLAEQERVTAESGRASAEFDRVNAESGRQTAENNRTTAEQNRATAETGRVNAESARGTAETNRANAETTRGSNESTRQSNESVRVNAENQRKTFYDGFSASISELTNSTVKYTAAQTLTTAQRYQARKNIGAAAVVDIKDAYELQEAVRQGRANQILSVGDFFTVGRGGTDWLFQVAAFDYDVPVDARYTHSMRLLMYPCFANVPFDAPEAIYYAAAELAAGTYWFINSRTGKYYSFTTTQAIPVGGQAVPVFGASPDYAITQIKTYASQTSTTALETMTATISDTAPTIGTQLTPVNDDNRARWGNNNWIQSAIRQWLNSAATAGWWTPKNIYDRPQSSPTDGFLNGIDADLLACIGKVRLRTVLNPIDNAGVAGYSDNEELIFLPSRTEVLLGNSVTGTYETPVAADGTAKTTTMPLFTSNADRIKYLAGVARSWWVRSPYPTATYAYSTYGVYTNGSLYGNIALNGVGAVPDCVIY